MTLVEPSGKGFVYNSVAIRDKGEMLSLTDMWKAAGSDPMKAPAQWQRLSSAEEFIAHVELIVGKSHNNLIDTKKRAGTWAHWQIALAYAKYLSPEFHMWCNSVVRSHMEGAPLPVGLTENDRKTIGGIVKNCAGLVIREQLANLLPVLLEPMIAARLAESAVLLRRGKTAKQIWDAAGFASGIKGSTLWFGNRLRKGGCMLEGKADRGDGSIRLFDPDKADTILGLGLRREANAYIHSRKAPGAPDLFSVVK
jgi:KilA-N domain.